jgi:hypothetical protein
MNASTLVRKGRRARRLQVALEQFKLIAGDLGVELDPPS